MRIIYLVLIKFHVYNIFLFKLRGFIIVLNQDNTKISFYPLPPSFFHLPVQNYVIFCFSNGCLFLKRETFSVSGHIPFFLCISFLPMKDQGSCKLSLFLCSLPNRLVWRWYLWARVKQVQEISINKNVCWSICLSRKNQKPQGDWWKLF